MFWTCPSLEKYWREVFQTLSLIVGLDIEPNPLVALFGTTGEVDVCLTPAKRRTLSFASLLARRAILLMWRDAAPPTHAQWLRDIMSCLNLEKIHYSIRNSKENSKEKCGDLFWNTFIILKLVRDWIPHSHFAFCFYVSNTKCTNWPSL